MSQTSFVQYTASSPPRPSKPSFSGTVHKGTVLNPPRSPTAVKKAHTGKLDTSMYRRLEGASDYTKAIRDGFKRLDLPFNTSYPSPDVLRKECLDALLRRNAMAREYAEAEQRYEDWAGALRQILGKEELRAISQSHDVVKADDADTVMGQFIIALTGLKMNDFCLSRKA